jgi:glutathione S-transferase
MSSTRPKIIYFNIRGRAEVIRLIFEELGVAYDEHRLNSAEEWKTMKPSTPFGSLPIYEEGDLKFAQTQAIYRHIARTRDLYGKNEREHVECDVSAEAISEAIETLLRFFWEPDYKDQFETFAAGPLTECMSYLESWFTRSSSAALHWVGGGLTYVDFFAYRFLDEVDAFFPAVLAALPALKKFYSAFGARPRIAAYIASGRRPAVFGIVNGGLRFDPRIARTA